MTKVLANLVIAIIKHLLDLLSDRRKHNFKVNVAFLLAFLPKDPISVEYLFPDGISHVQNIFSNKHRSTDES